MIDVIEAPVPVLLGITKDQFVTFDYKEVYNRMWVFLDDDQIEVGNADLEHGEDFLYEPYLDDLYNKIEPIITEIRKIGGNIDLFFLFVS